MQQLTKEQAIAFAESEVWRDMTDDQIVDMQLYQDKLCMPFSEFHRAITVVLGRPVYTHEFAWPDNLRAEREGKKAPATLDEIIALIPAEKRLLIVS